jgi:Flp pilus assembly pilin Flp
MLASMASRFHEDEEGVGVLEAILLIALALVLLFALYKLGEWAIEKLNRSKDDVEQTGENLGIR